MIERPKKRKGFIDIPDEPIWPKREEGPMIKKPEGETHPEPDKKTDQTSER